MQYKTGDIVYVTSSYTMLNLTPKYHASFLVTEDFDSKDLYAAYEKVFVPINQWQKKDFNLFLDWCVENGFIRKIHQKLWHLGGSEPGDEISM